MVTAAHIDGGRPLSAETVAALAAGCDRAEDAAGGGVLVVHVTGAPHGDWLGGLTVKLVNRWEQAVRRLERLPAVTVAAATGDCGGAALDALLATDHRIAAPGTRLVPAVQAGLVWPGMALFRLARQAPGAAAVRQAILFGTPIAAADALALHLVHEVADDPGAAVAAAVARAATVPGAELAIRRQLTLDASGAGFEDALGSHLAAVDRTLRRTAEASS
ncbi:enoyl-CoA-hydratase DpgB [Dactylosporangium sp. NPDC049140]|uniref:enoyl-CoA-hydratase DpgB n=1 Tax=Dactylosporangium sp. NPDC049140 TaxID=3155647 RepID=UPI0033C0871D